MKLFNTSKKLLGITVLMIPILAFSLPATSMPLQGNPKIGAILEKMADKLELSPQQRIDIRLVINDAKANLEPIVLAIGENRQQYKQLLTTTNPLDTDIQRLAEQQGRLVTESLVMRARFRLQLNALLSEQQQLKLQAYQDLHQSRASRRASLHKRR